MTQPWTERSGMTGATWRCAADTNVSNSSNDCPNRDRWGMNPGDADPLPFDQEPTDTIRVYSDGQTPSLSFDVTADVRDFLSGRADNHGWMLRVVPAGAVGEPVVFYTREGASPPTLTLEFGPDLCPSDDDKTTPGQCGCGTADVDADQDFTADCAEPSLTPSADNSLAQWTPNLNDGIGPTLGVSTSDSSTGPERPLIRFDSAEIAAAVGSSVLQEAVLELTVAWKPDGWAGGQIDLIAMTRDWAEGIGVETGRPGSTWNCSSDTNTANSSSDCAGASWTMTSNPRPYAATATATSALSDGETTIRFDVTADVRNFLTGAANNGWILIGRRGSGNPGWIYFASRETETPPRLRLTLKEVYADSMYRPAPLPFIFNSGDRWSFFGRVRDPASSLRLQFLDRLAGSWSNMGPPIPRANAGVTESDGSTWFTFDAQIQPPFSWDSSQFWEVSEIGGRRHVSATVRGINELTGEPLISFDDRLIVADRQTVTCVEGQTMTTAEIAAQCASASTPEVVLRTPCGQRSEACCIGTGSDPAHECEPGATCSDRKTCSTVSGDEGQPCNSDGSCSAGLVCTQLGPERFCLGPHGRAVPQADATNNACVLGSVMGNLQLLDSIPRTKIDYDLREGASVPPDDVPVPETDIIFDHIQSVQRLPAGRHNMMAITVSNSELRSGIHFVELAGLDGRNGDVFDGGMSTDHALNRTVAYFELPTTHPGGSQLLGNIFVTTGTNAEGRRTAWFYDTSNPTGVASSQDARRQELMLDSVEGGFPPGMEVTGSSAAALVKLASDRYLLAINGVGNTKMREAWLFLSERLGDDPPRANTRWYFHNKLSYRNNSGVENFNFVTHCDGEVYLLHTGNDDDIATGENGVTNLITVHELILNDQGKLDLTMIDGVGAFQNDGYCDFRTAANVYVAPTGRIALYCAGRDLVSTRANNRIGECLRP